MTNHRMSPWLLLVIAICAEVAGTLSLRASEGLTKLVPSLIGFGGYAVALYFLAMALREIEVGVAYAIWSALGTALVVAGGIIAFGESMTALRMASVVLVVIGVMGLRLSA